MTEKRLNADRKLVGLAAVALSVVAFCVVNSAEGLSKRKDARNSGQVVTLRKIDQLKEAFQRDAGKIRFVTILSPT
jgi:hypothetical protein